jgi:hypothetical protein
MRAFIKLRQMYISHKDLKRKIAAMEKKFEEQFQIIFEVIKALIQEDEKPKKKIGYLKHSSVTPWQGVMSSEIAPKPSLQHTANF